MLRCPNRQEAEEWEETRLGWGFEDPYKSWKGHEMFSEYQKIDFLAHQAQFFYVGIQFLYVIGIYKVQVIMLTDVYNMYLY